MLRDNHGRPVNYLRLAVIDKCNLRCYYCMPEQGLDWLSKDKLMSTTELLKVCNLFTNMGVTKIRITGGEPFVRKDMMEIFSKLSTFENLDELSITTNGVLTSAYIPELKKLGIKSVNLSLDTVNRDRFFQITRRDELPAVLNTLEQLLHYGIQTKMNAVVMAGKNTDDIIDLINFTKDLPVDLRFIEEMPFNGEGIHPNSIEWNHERILSEISNHFPEIQKIKDPPFSTSSNYKIRGHKGLVGIIAAYTRSFCGTCNRLRITPDGILKTCLYDGGVMNVRDLLRIGLSDDEIYTKIKSALNTRPKDGFEAEKLRLENPVHESMATIGG